MKIGVVQNVKQNKTCQPEVLRELFTNNVLFLIQSFIKLGSSNQSECILENSLFILNYLVRIPFLVYTIDILSKQNFRLIQSYFNDKIESFKYQISSLRPCIVFICSLPLSQHASISVVHNATQLLFGSRTASCDL